jgi:ferric-dicitrate binding protein FerR (iron transport regulator)
MTHRIQPLPAQDGDAWVSALFDGELDDAEAKRALGRLRDDRDAAAAWRDCCMVSDALHGDAGDEAFMARFQGALEAEPTLLAPVPTRRAQAAPYLWTAAAAAMATITWTVWTATPRATDVAPLAGAQAVASAEPGTPMAMRASANTETQPRLEAYLAAHQDYAYAVVSAPDIVVEKVNLAGPNR